MPYEHLSRQERRAMVTYSRQAAKRPLKLTELPRDRWPPDYRDGPSAPVRVWQSQKYLAQLFDAGACPMPLPPATMLRLSVCRGTLKPDGRWEEGLEWEELMQIKREIGYGDWYAVEVYPRDHDIVNVANMRHLWILAQPILIGWFKQTSP